MIKLPARQDGNWTVSYSSDKLPDLSATKNLSFDKEGYLRLSKPVVSYFSEADDADFGLPLFYGRIGAGLYYTLTDEAQFELDILTGDIDCTQTTATNAPINTGNVAFPGSCVFNDDIVYSFEDDIYTHPLGSFSNSWTDRAVSSDIGTEFHPICLHVGENELAVGDGDQVKLFSTAYALNVDILELPDDYNVTGIAYNNGYLGITIHDTMNGGNGQFYVWDGKSSTGNYAYHIGASTCTSPVAYHGSFVFLNGTGQLMYWTPQRLEVLAEFPSYFTNSQMFLGSTGTNRNESIWVDGGLIYINVDAYLSSATEDQEVYFPKQMGGIWCYDPAVGLYHRHATSSLKATSETIATTAVDTATDQITVVSAPETGTPVRYSDGSSTAITGLTSETIYYAIKVDATNIQLAETLTLAEAGTEIDLTGTGNNAQTIQIYPKSDFGQSYTLGQQGCVFLEETPTQTGQYTNGLFFGTHSAGTTTTEYDAGGFVLRDTENRGYFTTAKFMSSQLQDHWQKLYLKHKKLVSDLDKIVIKYRTLDDGAVVKITGSSDGLITWTDADTFTTTDTQFANVAEGDEVEIIQGTGSGYLAHVSSITEDSGTYTVNLDEGIKNLTASDTGRVVVSRWTKLTTITADTVRNQDGYSEIPVGIKSKQIQFKVELRGEDIEIEELLVANELCKPV